MADITLRSQRQIQQSMLSAIISNLSINDINAGSVIDVVTDAAAREDFALYYNLAQVSRLNDLNNLFGEDLENEAFSWGLTRINALNSTGQITIQRALGFTKVATALYAGLNPPSTGDTTLNVNDASNALIGTSGTLIIGRGTNNEEQVTYSVAPVNNTNYWTFTLDGAGITQDHAIEETVILAQGGDVSITSGTVVVVPATGTNAEIQFTIDNDVTLLDGEAELIGVDVTAIIAGTSGNIPVRAIEGTVAFSTPPFTGARAYNPAKFTTGTNLESEDALRDRIRSAGDNLTKGVKDAIQNAIVGLVDSDTAKRVVSASIILPVAECGDVKIYIDDGIGFEPSFTNDGYEIVRSNATGGETRLQIDNFPIVKANLESLAMEPYDMSSGSLTLIYEVGGVTETITFETSDFTTPASVSAEDVSEVINDKANLIEARTSQGGLQFMITAKSDTNENIRVTGGTANAILSLPTDLRDTVHLYLDDVKLSKDGTTAILDSGNTAPFNLAAIGAFPHTLQIIGDGKTANTLTASFAASDAANVALVTAQEVVDVLNRDLVGMTASVINSGANVRLESNTKLSSSSKLDVVTGDLNDATNGLNFSTTEVVGTDGDYTLNRELGIIELNTPLLANQTVTIGTQYSRGYLRASIGESYAPNNTETLIISVDGGANQTITFDASFASGKTASDTATFINTTLVGATAYAREIGTTTYLEIATNSYELGVGSIEVKSTSTGNAPFGFTEDTAANSVIPVKAYTVSGVGAYEFVQNDNLVVVVDGDTTNSTFYVLLTFIGSVTAGSYTTTTFADTTLSTPFTVTDELEDYYAVFTSGANTTSGTVTDVTNVSGDSWKYTLSVAYTGTFAINDHITFTGLDNSSNNGSFIITAIAATEITVVNANAVAATGQSGTYVMGQRRQVTNYVTGTGLVTVGSAFTNAPVAGEDYFITPSTVTNVLTYLNNTKITSLSLKADIEGATNNTKVQLTSKQDGSDGIIQVTGGSGNLELGFATTKVTGIPAYSYYTGLIDLVHKTVYGDDADLISYPGVGAAGITFRILPPTVKGILVQLNVTLNEGIALSSLENEIKSAVTGYVNNLGVGEDLVVESIRAAVIAISGIRDVVVTTPAANIAASDNELIRVSDPDITIG